MFIAFPPRRFFFFFIFLLFSVGQRAQKVKGVFVGLYSLLPLHFSMQLFISICRLHGARGSIRRIEERAIKGKERGVVQTEKKKRYYSEGRVDNGLILPPN